MVSPPYRVAHGTRSAGCLGKFGYAIVAALAPWLQNIVPIHLPIPACVPRTLLVEQEIRSQ
jgi:hypothetical protein